MLMMVLQEKQKPGRKARIELPLEKKLEVSRQSNGVLYVSEFAREQGVSRRSVYRWRNEEAKLSAAVESQTSEPNSRKRMQRSSAKCSSGSQKRRKQTKRDVASPAIVTNVDFPSIQKISGEESLQLMGLSLN